MKKLRSIKVKLCAFLFRFPKYLFFFPLRDSLSCESLKTRAWFSMESKVELQLPIGLGTEKQPRFSQRNAPAQDAGAPASNAKTQGLLKILSLLHGGRAIH